MKSSSNKVNNPPTGMVGMGCVVGWPVIVVEVVAVVDIVVVVSFPAKMYKTANKAH